MTKKETLKLSDIGNNEKIVLYTFASSESDIKMCMLINKVFHINMSLSEDLIIKSASESINFKKYCYEEEIEGEKYTLLLNQHPTGKFLFPEYKKIDYILIISSESNRQQFEHQIKILKEVPGISAIFKMDPSSVKSFRKLAL